MTNPNLPAFIRRDVERAIEDALHPAGISTHDGKARIGVDRLQYLMRMVDGLPAEPVNDRVLEFLRAFIAGGVNQDFKLWASELYEKLYRAADEPLDSPVPIRTSPVAASAIEPPREPQRTDFMTCGVPDDAAYEAAMTLWRAQNRGDNRG